MSLYKARLARQLSFTTRERSHHHMAYLLKEIATYHSFFVVDDAVEVVAPSGMES